MRIDRMVVAKRATCSVILLNVQHFHPIHQRVTPPSEGAFSH
jgi:hypothetical protein